ncbi:DUF4405 domain-containing protein [Myxococcota bacterium]
MNRNKLNFYLDGVSALVVFALVFTGFLLFFVLPPGTGGRHGGEALSLWGWTRHDFGDVHFYLACTFVALVIVHVWLHWAWACTTFVCFFGGSKPAGQRRRAYGIGTVGVLTLATVGGLFCARSQLQTTTGDRRGGHDAEVGQAQPDVSEPITSLSGTEDTILAKRDRPTKSGQAEPGNFLEADSGRREIDRRRRQTRDPSALIDRQHDREEPHIRGDNAITGQTTLAEAARSGGLKVETLRKRLGLPSNVDMHERLGRLKRLYGFEIATVRNILDRRTTKEE